MRHVLATALALTIASRVPAQITPVVLVAEGQSVNGQTISNLGVPTISGSGVIAFNGSAGVYTVPFGSSTFTTYASPRVYWNQPAQLVVASPLVLLSDASSLVGGGFNGGSATNAVDIYAGMPMYPTRLAQVSGPVPDYPTQQFAGATGQGLTAPTMGHGGRMAFSGRATNGNGLWYADADAAGGPVAHVLLFTGQSAPGVPGNRPITDLAQQIGINGSGMFAVQAWYQGTSGTQSSIFVGTPGSLVPLVGVGQVIAGRTATGVTAPRINDAGAVACSVVFGSPIGAVRFAGGAPELIAYSGGTAPGMTAGETFSSSSFQSEVGPPLLSGNGDITFTGRMRHQSSEDGGIWSYRSASDYLLIVRSGTPLPMYGATTTAAAPSPIAVDSAGNVVCSVALAYAGNISNDWAIMNFHRGLGLQSILRKGDVIAVPGGAPGTLASYTFAGISSGQDGFPTPINGLHQLVFRVQFTDNRQAILGVTLPAPPLPGAFNLVSPAAGAVAVETTATLAWSEPTGAPSSYTVSITPAGGPTTSFVTATNSFAIPAGLLQNCRSVTWGVTATNTEGTVASSPATQTFTTTHPADFNRDGAANVSDIFDFLAAWFAGDPRTDFNHSGTLSVADIFNFFDTWFAPCL